MKKTAVDYMATTTCLHACHLCHTHPTSATTHSHRTYCHSATSPGLAPLPPLTPPHTSYSHLHTLCLSAYKFSFHHYLCTMGCYLLHFPGACPHFTHLPTCHTLPTLPTEPLIPFPYTTDTFPCHLPHRPSDFTTDCLFLDLRSLNHHTTVPGSITTHTAFGGSLQICGLTHV